VNAAARRSIAVKGWLVPRYCDIIMKGGITSGIVYPAAVVEIAKDFVFKGVGGTSAGAIAAALTAAAERRRARDGSMVGFDRVGAIPDYLATDNRLFKLFAPNSGTQSLFRTVTSLFGRPRLRPAWLAKWLGLVWAFPIAAVIGAIPGVALAITATNVGKRDVLLAAFVLLAVATVVAGMTIAIGIALVRDLFKQLPKNFYGMVTGVDDADRTSMNALCTWLTQELELTAGLEPGKVPLTFGMLWRAKDDVAQPGRAEKPAGADVSLDMITTNVTWGRPYQFPNAVTFFFDPAEMKRFFPDHVVDWMTARARAPRDDEKALFAANAPGKLPLPLAGDLPVIVATRMSLAFPVLLSAVPLWAPDSSAAGANGVPLERCWFSDGGISSNFPLTLFDAPLAQWPTFGIDLEPFPPKRSQQADESKNVGMPPDNAAGTLPTFSRFDALPGFFSAILNAMQNWNDNTQSRLPGYRDRIVTVYLSDDEGGLNLDMPPAVLGRLRARGSAAGALLAKRFKDPSVLAPDGVGMNWENHRWLRYRSAMGSFKSYLAKFATGFDESQSPDVKYSALIEATAGTPVERYPLPPESRAAIADVTARAAELGTAIDALTAIDDYLPKPPPNLVVRASLKT
jgi:predicted acylesterase/phospholipase RssA